MPIARRTESAEQDLREIAYQIGVHDHRLETAMRVIDELIARCDKIASLSCNSLLGTNAPGLGRDVRMVHHKRWVILFRREPHGIDVLRFIDGSQDYMSWIMGNP